MDIILASSSVYRRAQLEKLKLHFTSISPEIDETAQINEKPADLALRLAIEKAQCIAQKHPTALVIGSDQVATINNKIIGKPGNYPKAYTQLAEFSGQTVLFYTAICVNYQDKIITANIPTECKFIKLNQAQIESYLEIEQPFDTAGSAKIEQLGIALMEYVRSDDPSALIGLPLIALCQILREFGVDPLNPNLTNDNHIN